MEQHRGVQIPDPRQWVDSLRKWIDPLSIVVIVLIVAGALTFIVGYVHPFALLQALGGLLVGAGLSALVGALSGRWAIRQQSAKEANLWRKEHTYGPLYAELKALTVALSDAKSGTAPVPLWIDNGIALKGFFNVSDLFAAPPTFKCWPEFRRDYRDTDFTIATQNQFDKINQCATTYNYAVEPARESAVRILDQCIDDAISATRNSPEYPQWQQLADSLGTGGDIPNKWFAYLAYDRYNAPKPNVLSAWEWLSLRRETFGWLLAGYPDAAARFTHREYEGMGFGTYYGPLPLDWIQAIFERAWHELQTDASFCGAVDAKETLLSCAQAAEGLLVVGLRRIQQQFEGGEPLV